MFKNILYIIAGGLMVACSVPKEKEASDQETTVVDLNPAGKNFNHAESDEKAIILADEVMVKMGGRAAYDQVRYLSWNFFGSRKLLWDKKAADVRIDFLKSDMKILMNVRNMKGKVWKDGQEITQADSLTKYLERGKNIWINDSYWLVMPFKLKDSGVTLKYARPDTTLIGAGSDVVTLTFNEVGKTPENKYEVWIDNQSKVVTQWAYYRSFEDTVARFTLPWGNYQQMGGILLSDDRGDRDLSEVEVLTEVPNDVFISFE